MTIVVIGIFVFAIAADQITKALLYGKQLALLPGVVGVYPVKGLNTGMAWSLLGGTKGSVILLSAVTLLTLAALTYLYIRCRRQMPKAIQIALGMICGGAVGNLIDRIALGGVRDFINFEFVDFPVFNVADIFVTCGGILLGAALLFTRGGHRFAELVFAEDNNKKKKKQ